MKQNLLFVIPGLGAGGAEKSLVNLLNAIDEENYSIDLLLFSDTGLFFSQIPKYVNVIKPDGDFKVFQKPLPVALASFFFRGKVEQLMARFRFFIKNNFGTSKAIGEQRSWEDLSKCLKPIEKKYDTAIAFLEKTSVYVVVDKVIADKKIAFIHNDYSKLGLNFNFDKPYFDRLDCLATVSEECGLVLKALMPNNRVEVVYNLTSKKLINSLAEQEKVPRVAETELLSIGRLDPQKGFDLALKAAATLKSQGLNFVWRIIGEGAERGFLETKIKEMMLQDHVKLLGLQKNPYPFLKNCDIYVQPSRFEGKSIAIDEAMLLGKPIVVTDFSTARDQITDGLTGLIAEMSPDSLAEKILTLSRNTAQRKMLSDNLKNVPDRSGDILKKFYTIL